MPISNQVKHFLENNMYNVLKEIMPDLSIIDYPKLTGRLLEKRFPGADKLSIEDIDRVKFKLLSNLFHLRDGDKYV